MKKIFVIAGEASGDLHGANLIAQLREQSSSALEIYGVGGDKIRQSGALEFFDLAHFHVTGLTDAIKKLPQYKQASKIILSRIQKVKPDLIVLIDNPGFNLHLASKVHAMGIPIVYYIAPQVWAWAPKRILKIKKFVKKVLVVFEFEKKIYEDNGIPVSWVGHPLKDMLAEEVARQAAAEPEIKKPGIWVALLPGSRKGEIKMLLPAFLKAARLIARDFPGTRFSLIKAHTLPMSFYEPYLRGHGIDLTIVDRNAYQAIRSSDLAVVCSGTATLECALLGTPMIIAYKGTFVSYIVAKSVIRVPYLGLPNLILGKEEFKELLQYRVTPAKIAAEAGRILENPALVNSMKQALKEVSRRVGEGGAHKQAAKEILKEL